MSKMVDQVVDVLKESKDKIYQHSVKYGVTSYEEATDIIKEQFKLTAKKYGVGTSTVRAKCTRELGVDTEAFVKGVIEQITNENDNFLNKLLENCKDIRGNDNKADIFVAVKNT